jgi:ketosteroid isomerase-like protein
VRQVARVRGNFLHPHEALIARFYEAFAHHDAEAMVACYHPDVTFSDPVFPDLHGARAGAMWRMLTERGKDLTLSVRDIRADEQGGSAHWDARYTYSATGRKVLNRIDARFQFHDGLIVHHRDTFDLWRWAAQALGPSGLILGWTPFVRRAIQRNAQAALDRYIASRTL